ncbi:MAG: MaoC family dehydratase N-terminal domain-containing protein [Dehalococcoidia bacterium]|nr:MaoC family dehydratase N-terminal domain-containing protein [Dehalococcoidia bacterium]
MAQGQHAVITEQMLQDVRKRIGVEWTPKDPFYNRQASCDTIRHFCDGIGDDNPLFRDEAYAKKTRWGRIIAPPSFYYSVFLVGRGAGLPGIHGWFSGGDWEFYRPLFLDEFVTPVVKMTDITEKKSTHAGRIFFQYSQVTFKTSPGEVSAKAIGWTARAERQSAGEHGREKHKAIKPATYTPEEMDRIVKAAVVEKPRGATPRFWEDVQVGQEMEPIVKGPLSIRDMYAWLMGGGSPFMKAHGIFYKYVARHPGAVMVDSTTGRVDVPELVHMEQSRASEIGVAGAYDYGPQRMAWVANLVTNWMGDDAFLWKLYAEIRRFNVVGDTNWLKGKLTRKYEEKGMRLVDLEIWAENQRGEITAPGRATVSLPSRQHGPAALPPKYKG